MSALVNGRRRVAQAFWAADAHPEFADEDVQDLLAQAGDDIVYFIQAGTDGPVKIGKSTRALLATRTAALQTGNPYPLELIGVAPGGHALEREIHALFAHLRMAGEWFYPEPQLLEVAHADPLGLL